MTEDQDVVGDRSVEWTRSNAPAWGGESQFSTPLESDWSVRPNLAAWLLEQIAEDERTVDAAGPARLGWATYRRKDGSMDYTTAAADNGGVWVVDGVATKPDSVLVVYDPARVLAECDAKRRIVKVHQHQEFRHPGRFEEPIGCMLCHSTDHDYGGGWCDTLRLLALPYVGRAGYRNEWRPS